MKNIFLASLTTLVLTSVPVTGFAQTSMGQPNQPSMGQSSQPSMGQSSQTSMGQPSSETANASDLKGVTDARIDVVKAALQLKPDQEQYWPAVEQAIRSRSKQRTTQLETVGSRVSDVKDEGLMESIRNANPVEFMNRRADALTQRAASLKQLASAWEPLYQTLSPQQKRRLNFVAVYTLHEMRDAAQQRRLDAMDDDDDE